MDDCVGDEKKWHLFILYPKCYSSIQPPKNFASKNLSENISPVLAIIVTVLDTILYREK
jgi:hypothetical protein